MSKAKPKLMIIDGNALIHRSFHALPLTMKTKEGTVVNALYGFTSFLLKAVRDLKPEYVVLALDKKGPTFRHEKFAAYKAKRIKAPDELYAQIPLVKEISQGFNIPIFEKSGFEADDIIGTIVRQVDGKVEKVIVTGDMDTLQLVNGHTKVYAMSRGVTDSLLYDISQVDERYHLTPEQIVDYKALRGDPSDNIPGVAGIGEKTAIELLSGFKTLDGVYKNLESGNIKPRTKELLLKNRENAYLSRELATIKCDVPLRFDLPAADFSNLDKDEALAVLNRFEFRSLMVRAQALFAEILKNDKQAQAKNTEEKFERNRTRLKYYLVDDEKKFEKFFKVFKAKKRFAFDTETSGFDPIGSSLLGISLSWKKGEAYYLKINLEKKAPVPKTELNLFNYREDARADRRPVPKDSHPWLERIKPIFENSKIKKIAHNAKFDIRVLKNTGLEVRGLDFDTMIASYVLNPGTRGHGLDALSFAELGIEKISKDDLLGTGRNRVGFAQADAERLALYSCEDADCTWQLFKKLKTRLEENKLTGLFEKFEIPLIDCLVQMEENGIVLDLKALAKMSANLGKRIKGLEQKIHKLAGQKFNIKSTKQLKQILFEDLEISTQDIKRTKTGISTSAEELEKLKPLHPIIGLIQEYRELTKLTSTYIDALPELINPRTNRVHTSYNQTITATGRLSSTDPNLQNIPIRSDLGREIRKAFVAPGGYQLLALDYSQIELRLAAHMSGDKQMIKAFLEGADIHTQTAALINQVEPEAVDKKMRREAKAVNFGILYGQGPHGLSRTADIPFARAKDFIDNYFTVFPGIKDYMEKAIAQARKKGYSETLFKRRRFLPEIDSSVAMIRKGAERMAINTPLQGTAADMLKIAMIEIHNKLCDSETRMVLTVHDELVFEIKDDLLPEKAKAIKKVMEGVISLKVPIIVDAAYGDNWGELKKLD